MVWRILVIQKSNGRKNCLYRGNVCIIKTSECSLDGLYLCVFVFGTSYRANVVIVFGDYHLQCAICNDSGYMDLSEFISEL